MLKKNALETNQNQNVFELAKTDFSVLDMISENINSYYILWSQFNGLQNAFINRA